MRSEPREDPRLILEALLAYWDQVELEALRELRKVGLKVQRRAFLSALVHHVEASRKIAAAPEEGAKDKVDGSSTEIL